MLTVSQLPPRSLEDRKSTRLNSSHSQRSYAVFCLKKKKKYILRDSYRQRNMSDRKPRPAAGNPLVASQHRQQIVGASHAVRPADLFYHDEPPENIYTLSLHGALPI